MIKAGDFRPLALPTIQKGNAMSHNPVGWFEIYVKDMSRARRFYESVFQVTLEDLRLQGIQMLGFPYVDGGKGINGALVEVPGYAPEGNAVMIYFTCEDCSVEAGRVEAAGGKIQRPKMAVGDYGFVVLVIDTEGNMIGLHSQK
jgi:predicted enzyme related to lactoylglutathione lyase